MAARRSSGSRWRKGQSGNPRGRKRGVLNRATLEARELCRSLTSRNEEYLAALQRRLIKGTEPASVVIHIWSIAEGKPVERVELSNPDGSKLFGDVPDPKLAKLSAAAAQVLGRSKHEG